MTGTHHPWRRFRDLTDWTLRWARLPDNAWGETCFVTRTVTISPDLNQAERRCTIAHETQHVLRGVAPSGMERWEEEMVDRNVARILLPDVKIVGEALAWADQGLVEAAGDLWVDEFILAARLKYLHPSERAYLRQRLAQESGVD